VKISLSQLIDDWLPKNTWGPNGFVEHWHLQRPYNHTFRYIAHRPYKPEGFGIAIFKIYDDRITRILHREEGDACGEAYLYKLNAADPDFFNRLRLVLEEECMYRGCEN
jgi:hypothetical protein